jgi:hypothetical protein
MELIEEEEKRELLEVLEGGYLFRYGSPENPAFKAKVYELEQEVNRRMGTRHAVAVNSGTSALHVALGGLGVGPGDEVIVPGYTFIASMSAIIHARPTANLFCFKAIGGFRAGIRREDRLARSSATPEESLPRLISVGDGLGVLKRHLFQQSASSWVFASRPGRVTFQRERRRRRN